MLIKKKENLLYLTGRSFMNGYLLVKPSRRHSGRVHPSEESRKKGSFGLSARPQDDAVFLGDGLERIDGVKSDLLKNVGSYISSKQTLEVFGEFTYAEVEYIKRKNPRLKIKVIIQHNPVDYLRMIKEPGEIVLVKKSMQIVEKIFHQVRREIKKPRMTEIRLAQFIQNAGLKMGAEDISFPAIVASGANAAVPHHVPSNRRLKSGEPIIIDFGFKYKNYCSDFTRTVFLKKVPKRLEIAYNQVERAYNGSMDFINNKPLRATVGSEAIPLKKSLLRRFAPRNGRIILAGDVYQKSVNILAENHLDKYFIHSLGHGTGLEIHELPNLSPNSKDKMADGMVFSIEPGVYIPKIGGIRIEDLVYLENGKVKKFINVPTDLKHNIIN